MAKGQADAWPPRGRKISRRVAAAPPRAPPPRGRRPRNRRVVAEARLVAAADPIEEVEERKAAKDRAAEGAERVAEVRERQYEHHHKGGHNHPVELAANVLGDDHVADEFGRPLRDE